MAEAFKIVHQQGDGEIVEKKSRFISTIYKVENEEQVTEILNATRKKYWDARHNCFAYVIGDKDEVVRCSDDGEPSGTAGKPILEVITGKGIHNCLVIVTRYFGGTLLGTGGLVRAYQGAANECIKNAVIAERISAQQVEITTDYNGLGKIQYIAGQMEIQVKDTEYTDKVKMILIVENEKVDQLEKKVIEATSATARFEKTKQEYILKKIEE